MRRSRLDPDRLPPISADRLGALDARTDAELAAAAADSDNPPLDGAMLDRLEVMAGLRRLRWSEAQPAGLRQALPALVGTLRDWEQGRTVPDQPARVLLRLIEREPEGVVRMLWD